MKTSDKILLGLIAFGGILYIIAFIIIINTDTKSTVQDYSLQNCSFISDPEKIMVCFDFNQDGKTLGAYSTSSKTIFLRTTKEETVRHEALHHLLYRDTNLNEEQQHKFIKDLETIEMEIFKLRSK